MPAKRVLVLLPFGDELEQPIKDIALSLLSEVYPGCVFHFLDVGKEYKSACIQQGWAHGNYSSWPAYVANSKVAGVYRYDLLLIASAETRAVNVGSDTVMGWHIGPVNLKLIAAMSNQRSEPTYLISELEAKPSLIKITSASKIHCYKQKRGDREDIHAVIMFNQKPDDDVINVEVVDE